MRFSSSTLRTVLIVGAAVGCHGAAAIAADFPGNLPTLPPPTLERSFERVEFSSGWYLRGDLGYRFQHTGSSSSGDVALVPDPTSSKLDNAFVFGLGAGIKRDWLRFDITGDYGWRSKYRAEYTGGEFSGKVESFTVLGNAYADLGTWYGLTPYVGAGIGGANVIFSSYENPGAVAPIASTAVPVSRWNLAWAVTAGVSYSVARNVLLDFGYRHVNLGDVSGGPSEQLTVKKLTGDEIRIGFRYLID
ncbi:MAG TPA: outer membrane beta-barrel protein [Pseudolabrys sp.]|nr:outer membrane beta-barrel protein [Pseudolabrys sp.]